jgi:hypothetical protein
MRNRAQQVPAEEISEGSDVVTAGTMKNVVFWDIRKHSSYFTGDKLQSPSRLMQSKI